LRSFDLENALDEKNCRRGRFSWYLPHVAREVFDIGGCWIEFDRVIEGRVQQMAVIRIGVTQR